MGAGPRRVAARCNAGSWLQPVPTQPNHGPTQFVQPRPNRLAAAEPQYPLQPEGIGTVLLGWSPTRSPGMTTSGCASPTTLACRGRSKQAQCRGRERSRDRNHAVGQVLAASGGWDARRRRACLHVARTCHPTVTCPLGRFMVDSGIVELAQPRVRDVAARADEQRTAVAGRTSSAATFCTPRLAAKACSRRASTSSSSAFASSKFLSLPR